MCGFSERHEVLFDQELQALAGHFVVLEEFYLNSCVGRARVSLARNPETNTAIAIEDVFFLVQKCSMRAYKTCSLVAALPMGNSVVEILREYIHETLLLQSQVCVQVGLDSICIYRIYVLIQFWANIYTQTLLPQSQVCVYIYMYMYMI